MKRLFLSIAVFFLTLSAFASQNISFQEIIDAANLWKTAVQERNPEKIANLYDEQVVFFPTTQNEIKTRAQLITYFSNLKDKDDVKVDFTESNIKVSGDLAVNSGTYIFTETKNGKTQSFPPARYTFVYQKTPKGWIIVHHHSSKMPA